MLPYLGKVLARGGMRLRVVRMGALAIKIRNFSLAFNQFFVEGLGLR